jgi:hypothetical protein
VHASRKGAVFVVVHDEEPDTLVAQDVRRHAASTRSVRVALSGLVTSLESVD